MVKDARKAIPSDLAGVISDAEAVIGRLNAKAVPALAPLARLLLRTESIGDHPCWMPVAHRKDEPGA